MRIRLQEELGLLAQSQLQKLQENLEMLYSILNQK